MLAWDYLGNWRFMTTVTDVKVQISENDLKAYKTGTEELQVYVWVTRPGPLTHIILGVHIYINMRYNHTEYTMIVPEAELLTP